MLDCLSAGIMSCKDEVVVNYWICELTELLLLHIYTLSAKPKHQFSAS